MIRQGNRLLARVYSASVGTFVLIGCFSLFGFALVGLWVATLLPAYANPGDPFGAWRAGLVGILWLAVCALGLTTRSTITIDPDRRVVELRLTRFGRGTPRVVPFAAITRVGVRRHLTGRRNSGLTPPTYVVLLETTGQAFEGECLRLASGGLASMREQAALAAAALGVECIDVTADALGPAVDEGHARGLPGELATRGTARSKSPL